MRERPVEAVGRRRTGRTASRVVRAEHEVVDDELRASVEELRECAWATGRVEAVLLLHGDPRQLPPQLCQLVTELSVFLLASQQRRPRSEPVLACSDIVISHRCLLSCERRSGVAEGSVGLLVLPPRAGLDGWSL